MGSAKGEPVTWAALIGQWSLVEYSLHAALGIDLEDVWHAKSWRWFATRVRGLLSDDTPLARFFAPDQPEPGSEKPEADDGR